jgi:hypothetical protein
VSKQNMAWSYAMQIGAFIAASGLLHTGAGAFGCQHHWQSMVSCGA